MNSKKYTIKIYWRYRPCENVPSVTTIIVEESLMIKLLKFLVREDIENILVKEFQEFDLKK